MQQELTENKVDITLYLAFGFKELSGEDFGSPPRPGKWQENGCGHFSLTAHKLRHQIY